jgi:chromosome segregation ATPase
MEASGTDQQPSENSESQERFADELTGPDDYWLTITDAARATRRQEVSIRRWISKGLLPVRRQHVGLNQRTRLVRASDLAALTPIIDPAGAITSERSRLDLTSIPAQQAQIKASQQTLLTQFEQLQHQLHEEALIRERLLTEQWTKNQEIIAAVRGDILTNVIQQQDALTQQRKEIDTTLAQQRGAVEHAVEALAAQTNKTFAELTQNVTEIAERLEVLARQGQESTRQQQQHIDELAGNLQQERKDRSTLTEHVEELSTQLTEQQTKYEHEVRVREQLAQQVDQLTSHIGEQQTRYEYEVQVREQLAGRIDEFVKQLVQQKTEQEQVQQRLLTALAQQQEQMTALRQVSDEQRQSYEILSQKYAKLQVRVMEQELALGEQQRIMGQYQTLVQGLASGVESDDGADNSLNRANT